MGAFIFLCDLTTEQECLDRNLFGTNPGDMHRDHYSKVAPGDTLFLYNFETGILRGPFAALTPCTMNIVPAAWRKSKRNFPWQVRVDANLASAGKVTADELSRMAMLTATKIGLLPPPELTEEQATAILNVLNP